MTARDGTLEGRVVGGSKRRGLRKQPQGRARRRSNWQPAAGGHGPRRRTPGGTGVQETALKTRLCYAAPEGSRTVPSSWCSAYVAQTRTARNVHGGSSHGRSVAAVVRRGVCVVLVVSTASGHGYAFVEICLCCRSGGSCIWLGGAVRDMPARRAER